MVLTERLPLGGPHPVAAYFSQEARAAAAAERYITCSKVTRDGTYRRTRRGKSPLAVLLEADGYGSHFTHPDSDYASTPIYRRRKVAGAERDEAGASFRQIRTVVGAFIDDWDAGRIPDIAAALGASPGEVSAAAGAVVPVPRTAKNAVCIYCHRPAQFSMRRGTTGDTLGVCRVCLADLEDEIDHAPKPLEEPFSEASAVVPAPRSLRDGGL